MAHEVVVPEVGEAGMEVVFVRWLKGEGDLVHAGEPLFELDTDKSVIEVESFAEGRLAGLRVAAGETVEPRQVVATLVALDEGPPGPTPESPTKAEGQPASVEPERATPQVVANKGAGRVSPRARRLARERGVDLSRIAGSGPDGLVTAGDLEPDGAGRGEVGDRQERVRTAVAQMTSASWRRIPHFHLGLEADVTDGLELARPMALLCTAVALSLARHPEYNLAWEGERLVRRPSVDLGILVDTPAGLLLPAIWEADGLGLEQMELAVAAAAGRAREGRLVPEDQRPKSISVSNLGMFSVDQFVGVIPAGDVMLLGVGRARTVPRWGGKDWVPRRIVDLTLSADHRALDGADAGRLLTTLESMLAEPGQLR
jgi:pyruvate dehydrogenase E2 component (dihydrolipoamide acetyltransferase)